MSVRAGERLGIYEITGALGAGGMGEVYRARDTRLGRDVALKLLPADVSADPERVARFDREAQVLASLNHPHIAAIHGLEESGAHRALVLELVEGPTLADRMAAGPLAVAEVIALGRQLADALAYAHDRGIVHRDLKPANIKVRPDGSAKVLDFGLAKAIALAGQAGAATQGAAFSSAVTSPTLTSPPHVTGAGVLLGTAAYMAPEQARGLEVDRRADIWALGVLLYEMLTGSRLFDGATVSDTIAAVLTREPDWSRLPSSTPTELRRLLRRCLQRDSKRRLADASDVRLELDDLAQAPDAPTAASRGSGWSRRRVLAAAAAGVALIAGGVAVGTRLRPAAPPARPYRVQLELPPGLQLNMPPPSRAMLSPDGRHLAMIGSRERAQTIWVRAVDGTEFRELRGTDGASTVFWPPDSRSIGFISRGQMKRIDLAGGPPSVIAEVGAGGSGATWSPEGVILFGSLAGGDVNAPLRRVNLSDGSVATQTTIDEQRGERTHAFPFFLPDGRHFLYRTFSATNEDLGVFVGSLGSPERREILKAGSNAIYADGYLLWVRDSSLIARRFDPDALVLSGPELTLAANVMTGGASTRTGDFSAAAGIVAYATGSPLPLRTRSILRWFDRTGKELSDLGEAAAYAGPRLSPDGDSVVVSIAADIWRLGTVGQPPVRLTRDAAVVEGGPVWSPDGSLVAFTRSPYRAAEIVRMPASGVGDASTAVPVGGGGGLFDWHGDSFVFGRIAPGLGMTLWSAAAGGGGEPVALVGQSFVSSQGRVSPDGLWIAYTSNESGAEEIYVQDFPRAKNRWRVSSAGGRQPVWNRRGTELFYIGADRSLMSVAVTRPSGQLTFAAPVKLFDTQVLPNVMTDYDVSPDGRRFLMNVDENGDAPRPPSPPTLLINWTAALDDATPRQ